MGVNDGEIAASAVDVSLTNLRGPAVAAATSLDLALWPAVLGGCLLATGLLGKRYGVEGAAEDLKGARSACTALLYNLSCLVLPVGGLFLNSTGNDTLPFLDPLFNERVPKIMLFGLLNGFGGLTATYAMALASNGDGSALLSMIQNGVCTVAAGLYIVVMSGQVPSVPHVVSAALIVIGVSLAQGSGMCSPTGICRRQEKKEEEPEERPTSMLSSAGSLALSLSVMAGFLWGFGALAKTFGVRGAENDLKATWSTLTIISIHMCNLMAALVGLWKTGFKALLRSYDDSRWPLRVGGVIVCGIASGLGGVYCTYAFTQAEMKEGALIAMMENGVYTVCGAAMIALVFREKPTVMQILSAFFVLAGILSVAA